MPRKEFLKLLALALGGLTMPVHTEPAAAVVLIALILLQFLN